MSAALFAVVIVSAVALWASGFVIWPAIARAKFVDDIAQLRDEVDDSIFRGKLPNNDPCVQDFLTRANVLIEDPRALSLSVLVAIHLTVTKYQTDEIPAAPTLASLGPRQRKFMHSVLRRERKIIARRLIRGSCMALPWMVARRVLGRKAVDGVSVASPRPTQLAKEYQMFGNPRQFSHA